MFVSGLIRGRVGGLVKGIFFGYEYMQIMIIEDDILHNNFAPIDYSEVAVQRF